MQLSFCQVGLGARTRLAPKGEAGHVNDVFLVCRNLNAAPGLNDNLSFSSPAINDSTSCSMHLDFRVIC